MGKNLIPLFILGFALTRAAAAQAMAGGLKTIWDAALKSDQDIRSASFQKSAAQNILAEFPSNFSPRVSSSNFVQKQEAFVKNKATDVPGLPPDVRAHNTSGAATVDVSFTLINNPLGYERDLLRGEVKRGEAALDVVKREKYLRLTLGFFEMMKQKERIVILRRNIDILNEQKNRIVRRIKLSLSSKTDLERINLLIDQRGLQITQTRGAIEGLLAELKRSTRLRAIMIPNLKEANPEKLFAKLREGTAEATPPGVRLQQAEIALNQSRVTQALSAYKPTFSLFGQLAYTKSIDNDIPLDPKSDTTAFTYGIRLDWVLWDSGAARLAESKLLAQIQAQTYQLGNLPLDSALEKKRLENSLTLSQKSIGQARSLIRSGRNLLEAAEAQVDAGLADSDLVQQLRAGTADNELVLSESNFASISTWISLMNEKGKLNAALIANIDEQWFVESEPDKGTTDIKAKGEDDDDD